MCKLCLNCLNCIKYIICRPDLFVLRVEKCVVAQVPRAAQTTAPLGQSAAIVEPPTHAGGEVWVDLVPGLRLDDVETSHNTLDDLVRGELGKTDRLLVYLAVQVSESPQHQPVRLLHPHLGPHLDCWEFVGNISPPISLWFGSVHLRHGTRRSEIYRN